MCATIPARRELVGDEDVKCIGSGPRPERDHQNSVAGLGHIQRRSKSNHGGTRIGVANHGNQESGLDLLLGETELRRRSLRELRVGLMKDGPAIILGRGAGTVHQPFSRFVDVLEVRRFTGEAHAVLRILGFRPAPEIRGVGDVGVGGVDDRQ